MSFLGTSTRDCAAAAKAPLRRTRFAGLAKKQSSSGSVPGGGLGASVSARGCAVGRTRLAGLEKKHSSSSSATSSNVFLFCELCTKASSVPCPRARACVVLALSDSFSLPLST